MLHNTLVNSSSKTRAWIEDIKRLVGHSRLPIQYNESKYWAVFKKESAIAYLHPSQKRIRLFLRLEPHVDHRLCQSPSSQNWKERFPAVFYIEREDDIRDATELIIDSYDLD